MDMRNLSYDFTQVSEFQSRRGSLGLDNENVFLFDDLGEAWCRQVSFSSGAAFRTASFCTDDFVFICISRSISIARLCTPAALGMRSKSRISTS